MSRRPPGRIRSITFDFGNTLLAVDRATLRAVVAATAAEAARRLGPFAPEDFLVAWDQERERQFREEVPRFREVDLDQRLVRVLARLRGMRPPAPEATWDEAAAATLSNAEEVAWGVAAYSEAFVRHFPPEPRIGRILATLAADHRLAILSNWPHAATVDRYAKAVGWMPHLDAVVVSQRVGTIKPHPAIFAAARTAIGDPAPAEILHVGDDWAADVVGAIQAGWRVAYIAAAGHDSPLPASVRDDSVSPDFELRALDDLPAALAVAGQAARTGR